MGEYGEAVTDSFPSMAYISELRLALGGEREGVGGVPRCPF
jgi:hypothetical protein